MPRHSTIYTSILWHSLMTSTCMVILRHSYIHRSNVCQTMIRILPINELRLDDPNALKYLLPLIVPQHFLDRQIYQIVLKQNIF